MGRLTTYLTILICVELLFIMSGQICTSASSCTFTSIIFSTAINPSQGTFSNWFAQLIGNPIGLIQGIAVAGSVLGALGLLIGRLTQGGVSSQALFMGLTNDSILFAGTGVALVLILGDFIAIYQYLSTFSNIAALLLMSPICTIYVLTVLEWVRGMP